MVHGKLWLQSMVKWRYSVYSTGITVANVWRENIPLTITTPSPPAWTVNTSGLSAQAIFKAQGWFTRRTASRTDSRLVKDFLFLSQHTWFVLVFIFCPHTSLCHSVSGSDPNISARRTIRLHKSCHNAPQHSLKKLNDLHKWWLVQTQAESPFFFWYY